MQCRQSRAVGFELANFAACQPSNAREAVLSSALFEHSQTFNFPLIDGDDELSADFMGYTAFSCIGCHLPDAADGKAGLTGTRGVVQASVQYPTIVTGLMLTNIVLLLEYGNSPVGLGLKQLICCRQPYDPASYDCNSHGPMTLRIWTSRSSFCRELKLVLEQYGPVAVRLRTNTALLCESRGEH